MTKYIVGDCYTVGDLNLLIVGQDDELDFIYFIALMKVFLEARIQLPFAPVHRDVLDSFLKDVNSYGNCEPSDISHSLKTWLDTNDKMKTFFTISPVKIWDYLIQAIRDGKRELDNFKIGFGKDGVDQFCLPIIFPIELKAKSQ
jgi:hypothetical protein